MTLHTLLEYFLSLKKKHVIGASYKMRLTSRMLSMCLNKLIYKYNFFWLVKLILLWIQNATNKERVLKINNLIFSSIITLFQYSPSNQGLTNEVQRKKKKSN